MGLLTLLVFDWSVCYLIVLLFMGCNIVTWAAAALVQSDCLSRLLALAGNEVHVSYSGVSVSNLVTVQVVQ